MYIILQSINIHTFYLHRQKYPQPMPNNCTHSYYLPKSYKVRFQQLHNL